MKKVLVLIVFVFAFSFPGLSQEKELMATADDGRRVVLKPDGTWQFIAAEIQEWRLVKKWMGSGSKNTESFTISAKEWRVCWITRETAMGGLLQITAYKGDSEIPDVLANVTGNSKDCSYVRGAGEYRLNINALQRWEIIVEEKVGK